MTNQLQHQQQPPRRAVNLRIPAIEKYAYCLCLHVKPTTIFIAVFKLIRALLFASMILNSEFTSSEQFGDASLTLEDRHRSTTAAVSILTRIIMASVSAVGIYAVVSGKAGLLMPLYAVLLVDFFFALPAFYSKEMDPSFADSLDDLRNYSAGNKQYTRYSLMLFSTVTMIVKIYFLCVVWKCYRYLRLIELVAPIRLTEIYPHIPQHVPRYPLVRVVSDASDLNGIQCMAPPPYESIAAGIKPPNYEEAIKSSTSGNFASVHPIGSPSRQEQVVSSNPNNDDEQQQQIVVANLQQPTMINQCESLPTRIELGNTSSETALNPSTETHRDNSETPTPAVSGEGSIAFQVEPPPEAEVATNNSHE